MSKQTIFGSCPSKSNSYRIIRFNNAYSLGKTNSLKKYEKEKKVYEKKKEMY